MKASNHGRSRIGGQKSAERFFLFMLIARGLFGPFPPFSYFLSFFFFFFFRLIKALVTNWKLRSYLTPVEHDDVIKWKHFPRYWPFVRGIHRPPVNSPHKGQWRASCTVSLVCAWINGWVNNGEASDLRRHRVHDGVTVMIWVRFKVYNRYCCKIRNIHCMVALQPSWYIVWETYHTVARRNF